MTPERREHVMRLHRQVPVIDCHNDSLQAVLQGDLRYNAFRYRPARPRRLSQKGESGHWDFPRALEAGQSGQMTNLMIPWIKVESEVLPPAPARPGRSAPSGAPRDDGSGRRACPPRG